MISLLLAAVVMCPQRAGWEKGVWETTSTATPWDLPASKLFSATLFAGCSGLMMEHGQGLRAGLSLTHTCDALEFPRAIFQFDQSSSPSSFHRTFTDLHRVFRSVLTYPVSLASLLPLYPPQVFSLINLPECLIPSWPLLLRQSKNSPAQDFLMAFFLTQNESHSPRGRSQGRVTYWCLSCWSQLLQLHTCSLCSNCTGCIAIS